MSNKLKPVERIKVEKNRKCRIIIYLGDVLKLLEQGKLLGFLKWLTKNVCQLTANTKNLTF